MAYRINIEPRSHILLRIVGILAASSLACQGLLPTSTQENTSSIPYYPCDGSLYPEGLDQVMPETFRTDYPEPFDSCAFTLSDTNPESLLGVLIMNEKTYLVITHSDGHMTEVDQSLLPDNGPTTLRFHQFTISTSLREPSQIVFSSTLNNTPTPSTPFEPLPNLDQSN